MKIKSASKTTAKPFVKWAGGKNQLISTFQSYYPKDLFNGQIKKYVEPFVGGGAVLFDMLENFDFEEVYIFDINFDLINTYKVIKNNVHDLINVLAVIENQYIQLNYEERKEYYYKIRESFNEKIGYLSKYKENDKTFIERASQFIFLNKTCFNGLFRVNKQGLFNVPMGDYKNPTICDSVNLHAVSEVLQNVTIIYGDYKECIKYVDKNTFVYFDPPYRPLNTTSRFTSYSKDDFNDENQIELANFYKKLDSIGAKLMLSNSNPKNIDKKDEFFDNLYNEFNIVHVDAKRFINSNGSARGFISELLITNYKINNKEEQNEVYQVL